MSKHLQKEIEKLKKRLLHLGALVEDRVRMAKKAIETLDADLSQKIIDDDFEIDEIEMDIEEECLKIIALYQPVAVDLRFLSAVIKINNDLERIADEAVNIAERILIVSKRPRMDVPFDYSVMAEKTELLLKSSLDAVVNQDLDMAVRVCVSDDEIDDYQTMAYDVVKKAIEENPTRVGYLINHLLISRHLERIADHATNIAEEVVYMIEGAIVRHGRLEGGIDSSQ